MADSIPVFRSSTMSKIKRLPIIINFSIKLVGNKKGIGKRITHNNSSCLNALSSK